MKLIKRLRNIWKLSEFSPQFDEDSINVKHPSGKILTMIEKPRMAQIIKMKDKKDIINDILNEQ